MREVRQIVQQREAGSSQQLCIVLHGITYEECNERVLPEYAADLKKLLGITALRGDQVCIVTSQRTSVSTSCSRPVLVRCHALRWQADSVVSCTCQASYYSGVEAQRAAKVVIKLLQDAGQLPRGYGDGACNQLPRPPPLLGREAALASALATLRRERLVVLVGAAGEGKSALAATVAHSLSASNELPGGAFAVDLAAAPTKGELLSPSVAPGVRVASCDLTRPGALPRFSQSTQ